MNRHALNWVVEGLQPVPRRVGRPHHWVVRQSSHLPGVPLEGPDFVAAHAKAPPVHLMLPKVHATLMAPNVVGVLEPHVPSMGPSSWSKRRRGTRWQRPQGTTHRWLVPLKLCLC